MSLSVSVYDYDDGQTIDVTDRVLSVTIDEKIDGSSSFSMSLKQLTETHAFDDITISYSGDEIFAGVIESQDDELRGGGTLYRYSTWNGSDKALKLENRIANKIYENMTVEAIIADLLASYPCGITGNNVRPTYRVIETLTFPYVSLAKCIESLADITGWRWYVDADGDLHFFDTDEGVGSTVFSTTESGGLKRNILRDTIAMTTEVDDKTANRVWIIGAKQAAANYVDQYWTGDGLNDTFRINLEPNYPEVREDGVLKTIELDRGQTSTKDYVYDKKNRTLRRVAGPLSSGVVLHLHHRPTTQIIDLFEDSGSIATYGIYEKAIKDKQITEKTAARARGRAELKRRASYVRTLTFDTRELDVVRGRRYRVVIPELGVDSYWLCTGVSTHISAPDSVNITKSVTLEEVG